MLLRLALATWIDFVEPSEFRFELLFRLDPIRIGQAAIHRADSRALWLIMEANTLGALIRYDVKIIGREKSDSARRCRVICPIRLTCEIPVCSTLVDRGVRAFGFASTTIDAFGRDQDRHALSP